MDNNCFHDLYRNAELHDYVNNESRRYSKRPELQAEYRQEAWGMICSARCDLPVCEYMTLAQKGINSAYRQNYKESLAMREVHKDPEAILLKESDDWVEEEFRLLREIGDT